MWRLTMQDQKMTMTKWQKFETMKINRSQMTNAPWNPRKIDEKAKSRLKKIIKKHGLVTPVIWNKRTGHIIGGHQRIEIIDSLEKNVDYLIDVSVLDVDEKEEVQLNVALNNQDAMGEFDWGALQDLQEEFGLDPIEDFAFDSDTAEINFPELYSSTESNDEEKRTVLSPDEIQSIRDKKKNGREKMKADKEEFGSYNTESKGWVTLVFSGEKQKRAWLSSIGSDENTRVILAKDVLDLRSLV